MNRKKNAGVKVGGFKRFGHRSTVHKEHGKNIKHQLAREKQIDRLRKDITRSPSFSENGSGLPQE